MIIGLIVQAFLVAIKLFGIVSWSWWVIMVPTLTVATVGALLIVACVALCVFITKTE